MSDLFRLLTLQDANTRVVLLGTTLLGVAAAVVGCFAVLRRRALVGDAAAHAALPGVCAAYFVVGERSFTAFMVGALVFGLLAAAFVSVVKSVTRIKEDAAIALAVGGFFGLGIVLSRIIQNQPTGNRAGLDSFIFGKAASMVAGDAGLILIVAGGVLLCVALLYKELRLLCFDRDFAAGQGWPTLLLDLLLMALVCICTVAGLPAVGVVLMVALLVIPGAAARFWTDRLGVMLLVSGLFGGSAGMLGTALSATVPAPASSLSRGWPTGPMIVLVAAAVFAVSFLAAPRRGLIAAAIRRTRLRRRIAMQHLLRDAFELLEPTGDFLQSWRPAQLAHAQTTTDGTLERARKDGLIAASHGGFVLTDLGRSQAARIVRTHRLWELYMIEQAHIAPDHVDRDADDIEHLLPANIVDQLEARLAERRQPTTAAAGGLTVPQSPHPLGGSAVSVKRIIALLIAVVLAASPAQSRADGPHALARVAESGASPLAHDHARVLFHIGSYPVRADDLWTVATAACCSVACGVVGCFLVLRRMSLLGDAISHAILPGLALAFIVTGSREPPAMLAGALAVGVFTALLSSALSRRGRVTEDAAMGVVFTSLFAVGVLLITMAAGSIDLDPGCVLYGLIEFVPFDTVRVAGLTMPRAFVWLAIVMSVNVALIVLFFKELRIVCFDPFLATTMGISAAVVHYGLLTCVAATCVASFEAVGSILVVAMLVAPGATAQLLTDRLSRMLWWAAAIAAACAIVGYACAVWFNTSVAGMIATVSLAMFMLAVIASPRHGLIADRMRRRILLGPEGSAPV